MGSTTLILGLSNMRSVTVTGYGDNFDLIRITKPFGHTAWSIYHLVHLVTLVRNGNLPSLAWSKSGNSSFCSCLEIDEFPGDKCPQSFKFSPWGGQGLTGVITETFYLKSKGPSMFIFLSPPIQHTISLCLQPRRVLQSLAGQGKSWLRLGSKRKLSSKGKFQKPWKKWWVISLLVYLIYLPVS